MGLAKKDLVMVSILLSGVLLVVLNQTLLSPAFPAIMAEFSIDTTTVQWLASGYSLVEAIIIPLSAFLIGRFSTRKLYIGGLSLFMAGSILAAWAPSFSLLLLGRVCQAVGTGVVMPMVITVILLIFPRESRGSAMGVIGLIIGFAPAVGPTASGLLVDSVGWHALFLIVTAIALLVVLLAVIFLKNYGDFEQVPLDLPSVALSSTGLLCLLYGFSTFSSSSNLVITLALIAVGAVFIVLFVRRQTKLDVPMLKVKILKIPRYATAVVGIALMQAALVGLGVILPLFIQLVLGQPATVSGLATLPGAVLGAAMSLVAGKLFDRNGARKLTLVGSITALATGIALACLTADASIFAVTAAYACMSMSMQFIMTPMNTWGLNSLDNNVLQHANSLSNTINQIAGSFGTALIVSLSALSSSIAPNASPLEQAYLGNHIAFITIAILFGLVFLLVVLRVKDKTSESQAEAEPTAAAAAAADALRPNDITRVSQVMNTHSPSLPSNATVRDAIRAFSESDTSGITIVDSAGVVVGFLSDGDLMNYLGRNDIAFADAAFNIYRLPDDEDLLSRLHDLMGLGVMKMATRKVIAVDQDAPLDEACHTLAERRIKKMPVVKNGRLVGALSRRNVIHAMEKIADGQQ